jgi:hypothetical protein
LNSEVKINTQKVYLGSALRFLLEEGRKEAGLGKREKLGMDGYQQKSQQIPQESETVMADDPYSWPERG